MTDDFSVLIRCRNEERWIGYAIQSVLDYHPRAQIIVIDDDSTDNSRKIVKMFCHDNVILTSLQTAVPYSPGRALNEGVKLSRRSYILIMSAHCQLTSPVLVDGLAKHCAVWGKQVPVRHGKKITPRYIWSNFGDEPEINYIASGENRYFLHNALALYKTDTLRAHPFDQSLAGKEDRYWAKEMIDVQGQTILYLPQLSCLHHWTQNGATWQDS